MAVTTVVFENRFDVPPEYAAKWLTDFRPDDGQRYFGNKATVNITRKGNECLSEGPHVMGWAKGVATLESATHWHARNEFSKAKGSPVFMIGTVKESVKAEGTGTAHRAEIGVEPLTLGMKLMFGFMGKTMMRKSIAEGFAKIKVDMESAYKAGRPPTA